MKDPFTDDKRCIILGSHCSVCKKSVCVSQNCSYFYTRRYCIPCLMPILDQFPEEVKQARIFKEVNMADSEHVSDVEKSPPEIEIDTESKLAVDERKGENASKPMKAKVVKNSGTKVEDMSKEQLIDKVQQLERHVFQLKNILAKATQGKSKGRKERSQRPLDFNKYNTRHVALKFLYLGWDYNGYAVQEDSGNTIEHQLFEALLKTRLIESRETSNYHRCGRTDKGVSAFSQVVSIDLRSNLVEGKGVKQREDGAANQRPGDKSKEIDYVHILNKVLPAEIRMLAWCPADADFSARFSCTERTYKYLFPQGNLDLDRMKTASKYLLGEHDFRNLCKMDVNNGVVNYMRKIHSVDILVSPNNLGHHGFDMCQMTVVGQAFLWHQIRCIIAVLILIGQGKEEPNVLEELLNVEKHPCKPQYAMASELPLVLFECKYNDIDWIYDSESHTDNVESLQEMWTQHAIKTGMIEAMLGKLYSQTVVSGGEGCEEEADEQRPWVEKCKEPVMRQADFLMAGSKPRQYKPLLEREKCDTLENRIEHFTKRRRIVIE